LALIKTSGLQEARPWAARALFDADASLGAAVLRLPLKAVNLALKNTSLPHALCDQLLHERCKTQARGGRDPAARGSGPGHADARG